MIKTQIEIVCDKCHELLTSGKSCYCKNCFKNQEKEMGDLETELEFTDKKFDEFKKEQNRKLIITKKDLKKLYKALCLHQNNDVDTDCDDCCLRMISWPTSEDGDIMRDLCFAIWHEGILEKELT